MPDQTYAARLRQRALEARADWGARHPERAPVPISQDEADALAHAVSLLVELLEDGDFTEESWYDEEGVEGTRIMILGWGWEDRIKTILDRQAGHP